MTRQQDQRAILRGMKGAFRLLRDMGLDQGQKRAQRVDVFAQIECHGMVEHRP